MKEIQRKLVVIIVTILIIAFILPIQVFATNENLQIIKTDNDDYIIYVKDLQKEKFEFGITQSAETKEIDINYMWAELDDEGNNVVFISKDKYERISGQENYLFIKKDNKILIKGEKLDFSKAFTKSKMQEVESTTKRIKTKLETDIIQQDEEINGVKVKTTVGGLKIEANKDSKYYYSITKLPTEKYNDLKKLADKINNVYNQLDRYSKIELTEEFYNIYENLVEEQKWQEVKDNIVMQPKNAQKDEEYVVFLKEINIDNKEIIDVQFLVSYREDEEEKIPEKIETIIVKETTKLPITGDNITLIIILAIVIVAIIVVFIRMKKIEKKK